MSDDPPFILRLYSAAGDELTDEEIAEARATLTPEDWVAVARDGAQWARAMTESRELTAGARELVEEMRAVTRALTALRREVALASEQLHNLGMSAEEPRP